MSDLAKRKGTVARDESGRWYFRIDVQDRGRPRRQVKRRRFATEGDALAALHRFIDEHAGRDYAGLPTDTFGGYMLAWCDSLELAGRRPSTIASYRANVQRHIASRYIGKIKLTDLRYTDLDELYRDLLRNGRVRGKGGLSPRSVRYLHSIIGKALRDAERKHLIALSPARQATPPGTAAAEAPERQLWNADQLAAFLAFLRVRKSPHACLFHVAATTGLRRAELLGLKWSDIDLDARVIKVRRTLNHIDGEVVYGKPKTRRSRRDIGIDDDTVHALRQHRKVQQEHRLLVGSGYRNGDVVFASPDGTPWNPDSITKAFAAAVEASGLPQLTLHGLRHVHASLLLAAGTNARDVSERLGHSSVGFTLNTYVQSPDGAQHKAAETFAGLIASPRRR